MPIALVQLSLACAREGLLQKSLTPVYLCLSASDISSAAYTVAMCIYTNTCMHEASYSESATFIVFAVFMG